MNDKIKAIIEEAKLKCKSVHGEGHYTQSSFWHFIVQIENALTEKPDAVNVAK